MHRDWCCLRLFSFVLHCHFILINILYLFMALETNMPITLIYLNSFLAGFFFFLNFRSLLCYLQWRCTQNQSTNAFIAPFLKTWNKLPFTLSSFCMSSKGCTTCKLSTIITITITTMTKIQLPAATKFALHDAFVITLYVVSVQTIAGLSFPHKISIKQQFMSISTLWHNEWHMLCARNVIRCIFVMWKWILAFSLFSLYHAAHTNEHDKFICTRIAFQTKASFLSVSVGCFFHFISF